MRDPDSTRDGWRRLACAILLRAVRDAADGNGHSWEARQWLGGPAARELVSLLDLDPAGLDRVLAGVPRPRYEQPSLFDLWRCDSDREEHPRA
jgi:hypothetical protein